MASSAILAGPASIILAHQKLTATLPQNMSNPFDVAATVQPAYCRCAGAPRLSDPLIERLHPLFDECAVRKNECNPHSVYEVLLKLDFTPSDRGHETSPKPLRGPIGTRPSACSGALIDVSSGARVMRRVSTGRPFHHTVITFWESHRLTQIVQSTARRLRPMLAIVRPLPGHIARLKSPKTQRWEARFAMLTCHFDVTVLISPGTPMVPTFYEELSSNSLDDLARHVHDQRRHDRIDQYPWGYRCSRGCPGSLQSRCRYSW